MKKLLLLSAILIFACSSKLFCQEYMKMNKKNLRLEHQKKLKQIDSLKQVLDLTNYKNQNLQSDLNNANNGLSIISDSLKNSNLKISQLESNIKSIKKDLVSKIKQIEISEKTNSNLNLKIDSLKKNSVYKDRIIFENDSIQTVLFGKLMDSISKQKLLLKKHIVKTDESSINFNNINTIDYNDVKFFINDNVDISEKVTNRIKNNNFYIAFIPDALFYLRNDNSLIDDAIIRYDNSPEGNFLIYISKGSPYKYVWFFEENNSFRISQSMEKVSEKKWYQKEYYGRSGRVIEGADGKLREYEEYLVVKGDFIKSGLEIQYYPSGKIMEVESGLLNRNPSDNTKGLISERYFYENGQLAAIEIYINNKKIVRYWDENGRPITR